MPDQQLADLLARKMDEARFEQARRTLLSEDDFAILKEEIDTNRAVSTSLFRDQLRPFFAHGVIAETPFRAFHKREKVYPLTMRGLKLLIMMTRSLNIRYDINPSLSCYADEPLGKHNRQLFEQLSFAQVFLSQENWALFRDGTLIKWAVANDVCLVPSNSDMRAMWVSRDDVPLFRLKWEGQMPK